MPLRVQILSMCPDYYLKYKDFFHTMVLFFTDFYVVIRCTIIRVVYEAGVCLCASSGSNGVDYLHCRNPSSGSLTASASESGSLERARAAHERRLAPPDDQVRASWPVDNYLLSTGRIAILVNLVWAKKK